jgi:3-deoxy-D-arabino-heptulosonate 7-phosphate (DAHP) synthase
VSITDAFISFAQTMAVLYALAQAMRQRRSQV